MTSESLAESYLGKALLRLEVLDLLLRRGGYSDVVREAQETVELALKAMLRHQGIEPPKWHDVGGILEEHAARFPTDTRAAIPRLAAASGWLRKERELAFYGDIDFIPSAEYDAGAAQRAITDARFVVEEARRLIRPVE